MVAFDYPRPQGGTRLASLARARFARARSRSENNFLDIGGAVSFFLSEIWGSERGGGPPGDSRVVGNTERARFVWTELTFSDTNSPIRHRNRKPTPSWPLRIRECQFGTDDLPPDFGRERPPRGGGLPDRPMDDWNLPTPLLHFFSLKDY